MAFGTISRITDDFRSKFSGSQMAFGTMSRVTHGFRNNVQDHRWLSEQFPGSQMTLGTIFRITDGFRNNVQDHRWLSEQFSGSQMALRNNLQDRSQMVFGTTFQAQAAIGSQNKLPGEGFLKGCLHLVKWFHRSKRKLYFIFSSQKYS